VNFYGASKLRAEEAVRAHCPNHAILRATWLYGEEGGGFPERIVRKAREGGEIEVVTDQLGSPTSARVLADVVHEVATRGLVGLFHACCSGDPCTKHELAVAAVRAAGLDVEIGETDTATYSRFDDPMVVGPPVPQRPRDSSMDCVMLREAGVPPLPDWRDELISRFSREAP